MKNQLNVNITPKSVVLVLVILLMIYFSIQASGIIFLFILAYILASALRPIVRWLVKKKIPAGLASMIVVSLFILIFISTLGMLVPVVGEQVKGIYDNKTEIVNSLEYIIDGFPPTLSESIYSYSHSLPDKIKEYVVGPQIIDNIVGLVVGLSGLIIFIVVTAYILIDKSTPSNLIKKYWPKESRDLALDSFKAFDLKISQWVRGQMILSVAVGLLSYIGFKVLGLPYAELLAVIAAVTELIPYVGPWIGGLIAVVVALTVSPILGFWTGILAFGIQQFESAVLVPRVMKKAVDLSPVTILFIIAIGLSLFGVWGAIISIPLVAGFKAAIDVYLRRING